MSKIKVIVVDDSALMRKIVSDMIDSQPDMEVIDKAKDGQDLIKKLILQKPDVITLDVEMPRMNGIETLKELKKLSKEAMVIMLSSLTESGAKVTFECLENGAFDFVQKPSGSISLDIDKVKDELIKKIRIAALNKKPVVSYEVLREKPRISRPLESKLKFGKGIEAIVIAASTGGPKALFEIITKLPRKLGVPVFVVQHMPIGFTRSFAQRLDSHSQIAVVEASQGLNIEKDTVYIAKSGYHMEVNNRNYIELKNSETLWGVKPAADKLFISASSVYGKGLMSVVLTGMGKDGAKGTKEVKTNGGYSISESKETCTIYGMPRAAEATGSVDEVVPLYDIAERIVELVKR